MKFSKLFMLGLTLTVISLTSCSKDGDIGPIGPQGEQGVQGPSGTDGTNGADGNANVQVLTYDLSTVSGSIHDQSVPEITEEVFANDLILGYVSSTEFIGTVLFDNSLATYPLPAVNSILPCNIAVFIQIGVYGLDFVNETGGSYVISEGNFDSLKVVIIESTSTTTGKSSKGDILSKLKNDGVDTSNYYEVMDYFGLEY